MSRDIIIVFIILLFAILMFSLDRIRNDVASIIIMLSLAWTKVLPLNEAFAGFSSNAVIAIMGVMIVGYGIEKTGVMDTLAQMIIKKAGTRENRIIATVMGVAGIISSFLQNIGAVALFLPAVKKIGSKANINPKKLIMPLAFAGVLGGTLTMVASGPLIVLNDLLSDGGYEGFGLMSVGPIGLALLLSGILYFFFLSGKVLPGGGEETRGRQDKLVDIYHLPKEMLEAEIPQDCGLIGKSIEELAIWKTFKIHILAIWDSGSKTYIPWRKTAFKQGQVIALYGENDHLEHFLEAFGLKGKKRLSVFHELENEKEAGFAEIILPPDSSLRGKTLEEIALRKNFKIEPIIYIAPDGSRLELMNWELKPGLKIIVFGRWEDLNRLKETDEFVVISEVKPPKESVREDKKMPALIILGAGILLILLGVPLPLSFLSAVVLMLMTKVIYKEEIYKAIDWKTVFLLAGLIPLGTAFDQSGAAKLTAEAIINVVASWPLLLILLSLGLITSFFSLFMSNVAATVLLVPMVLMMGESFGADPRALALFVAVSASNSFILPTHQVNAYVMGPGQYTTSDFFKAGSIMSVVFLLVSSLVVYFFYI